MFNDLRPLAVDNSLRIVSSVEVEKDIAEQRPAGNVLEKQDEEWADVLGMLECDLKRDEDDIETEDEKDEAIPNDFDRGIRQKHADFELQTFTNVEFRRARLALSYVEKILIHYCGDFLNSDVEGRRLIILEEAVDLKVRVVRRNIID